MQKIKSKDEKAFQEFIRFGMLVVLSSLMVVIFIYYGHEMLA